MLLICRWITHLSTRLKPELGMIGLNELWHSTIYTATPLSRDSFPGTAMHPYRRSGGPTKKNCPRGNASQPDTNF